MDEKDFLCSDEELTYLRARLVKQTKRLRGAEGSAIFLAVSCLIMVVVLLLRTNISGTQCSFRTYALYGEVALKAKVFEEDHRFVDPHPASDESAWSEILPFGGGAIEVPSPSSLGLSGGLPATNGSEFEGYGTSMFHQLHCIFALKSELMSIWANDGRELYMNDTKKREKNHWHMNHCAEYIRQGIMCSGDLTLERAQSEGSFYSGATPWGAEHTCVDFETILEFNSKHHFRGLLRAPWDEKMRNIYLEKTGLA